MTRSLSAVQTAIRRTTEYVIRAVRNVVRVRRVPSAERVVAVARGAKLQAASTARAQQPHVESGVGCIVCSGDGFVFQWYYLRYV